MAKSMSRQTAISNLMPIPIFQISYSPIFVRGAKREMRDEDGKLLYSSRQMRIRTGKCLTEEEANSVVKRLEELGYKNVKAENAFTDLPRKCPRCEKIGSPSTINQKRNKVKRHECESNTSINTILRYNHSDKGTCYIGKITFSAKEKIKVKLQVSNKIKKDTFSLKNRFSFEKKSMKSLN